MVRVILGLGGLAQERHPRDPEQPRKDLGRPWQGQGLDVMKKNKTDFKKYFPIGLKGPEKCNISFLRS